ncbi:hypothetical protein QQS21_000031 [Conoideocrella luteorostrata]|uniref:Uncharacterized protein n=1 Tax=Conoideocrella luteorostrata TaxID=1105319 RepID=A0AAJ0G2R7_9HYPO|nr:hypothetical protein QQS21_000031 [Conoideocrella luteorostrata]
MNNAAVDSVWEPPAVDTWDSSTDDSSSTTSSVVDLKWDPDPVESDILQQLSDSMDTQVRKSGQRATQLREGIVASLNQLMGQQGVARARNPNSMRQSSSGGQNKERGIQSERKRKLSAISTGKVETPVPLPLTVMNAVRVGSKPSSVTPKSMVVTPALTPTAAKSSSASVGTGSSSTQTRVPLPHTVMQGLSASEMQEVASQRSTPESVRQLLRSDVAPRISDPKRSQDTPLRGSSSYGTAINVTDHGHIFLATDGRPYSTFVDEHGNQHSTWGAVIPEGYKLHDVPECSFICPFRDCRSTLSSISALGHHFAAGHSYLMVNDNLDGTIHKVGTYKNASGGSPTIVVSQNPLPADAPPLAEPRVPARTQLRIDNELRRVLKKQMAARDVGLVKGPAAKQITNRSSHGSVESPGSRVTTTKTSKTQTISPSASPPAAIPSKMPSVETMDNRRPVRQSVLNRIQADGERRGSRSNTESPSLQLEPMKGVKPGQFAYQDHEMEDWELAPGRVTSQDSSLNVAYSSSFLTSSKPIPISPDVCFNVLTIRPGQIYHVPQQNDIMQVYSVASGKVKIRTGGQAIQLGPHGAFPVRPGEECIIENRLYCEALIHCTTVKDYAMAS